MHSMTREVKFSNNPFVRALIHATGAADIEKMKELIAADAPLDFASCVGKENIAPAIFQAICINSSKTLQILLDAGADTTVRCDINEKGVVTPAQFAIQKGHIALATMISDENKKRQAGLNPEFNKRECIRRELDLRKQIMFEESEIISEFSSAFNDRIKAIESLLPVMKTLIACSTMQQFVNSAELLKLRNELEGNTITLQSEKSTQSNLCKKFVKEHKYNVLFAALNLIDSKIRSDGFLLQAKFIIDFKNALEKNPEWNHIDHDFFGLRKSATTKLVERVQALLYVTLAPPLQNAPAVAALSSSSIVVGGAAMFAAAPAQSGASSSSNPGSVDGQDALDLLAHEMTQKGN